MMIVRRFVERMTRSIDAAVQEFSATRELLRTEHGQERAREAARHQAELERAERRHREAIEALGVRVVHEVAMVREGHRIELNHIIDAQQQITGAWRDQVARQAQELTASRQDIARLEGALLELKREGWYPPTPAAHTVKDLGLPAAVRDIIDEIAWNAAVTEHLERFAWGQIERGTPVDAIVKKIREGDGSEDVPRAKVRVIDGKHTGDLPADATVEVMDDDDETTTDEEDDDDEE